MAVGRKKLKLELMAPDFAILVGSAEKRLAELADDSVQTTITSPPYYRQKDYHVAGQIGWERSVTQFVEKLRKILSELLRITAPTGSCFFIVGDSYVNKSLQLVPQRLAIAAVESGWTLRNDLIWVKSDAAPNGAADRWRTSHEHILFLTKQPRGYKFNDGEIRVPYSPVTLRRWADGQRYGGNKAKDEAGPEGQRFKRGRIFRLNDKGTIPRHVIECATARSPLDHFATFPMELIEQFVLASTDNRDLVLDPFAGTATSGVAALQNARRFVGIELNPEYAKIAQNRLKNEGSRNECAA